MSHSCIVHSALLYDNQGSRFLNGGSPPYLKLWVELWKVFAKKGHCLPSFRETFNEGVFLRLEDQASSREKIDL